ncbi:MAG: DNA replication/repair protein RecF [Sandaracinaceae bacterium]
MTSAVAFRVERLALTGFRNLRDLDLRPAARFNVLGGGNGEGKSNLLEGVYYLGCLRSFRGSRKDDLIAHGADRARLVAWFRGGVEPREARVELDRARPRRVALDGKRPRTTADWLLRVPMVLFHPGDLALASGAPEGRRAFLDRILEQVDGSYPASLAAYTKALRSRNRLLKAERPNLDMVAAYDVVLAREGAAVGQARGALAAALAPRAEALFARVTEEQLPLQVAYRPKVEPVEEALQAALTASFRRDRARGFTGPGPHADDLALTVGSARRGARHHASQGQHRLMVLSLKVSELDVLTERVGRVPVLLLDDVSSELDRSKTQRFFDVLDERGGQVFLTTTHPELFAGRGAQHRVRAGRIEGT